MNAVEVESLSKRYQLGGAREAHYKTIRDSLARMVTFARRKRVAPNEVWALRDVSFEVKKGEAIGIIGKNGAGKSTLLKILSRITEPTSGTARLRGRVASLLEVGTGFHPELTGRENVFLNGSILGMSRREIQRDFDAIVAFAEIERFLDTPVKRYSSGMYVRLAFAVAAHLTPEILIVDEVLAVGDAEFQKRCLGRMGEVARSGRTVLYVSHNLTSVNLLCERAIWIKSGQIREAGAASTITGRYLSEGHVSRCERRWERETAPGTDLFRILRVFVHDASDSVCEEIESDREVFVSIEYENLANGVALGSTVMLFDDKGNYVLSSLSNRDTAWHGRPRKAGVFRSTCRIPGDLLNAGRFSVSVIVWQLGYAVSCREDDVVEIRILDSPMIRGDFKGDWLGPVRPRLDWKTTAL